MMKKRILTFVLSLVMILSCVTVSAFATEADDTWYSDEATELYIYDAADLLAFAAQMKTGTTFDGKTVYLCNDIALTGENNYNATNQAYPFSGTFDGQGYVISGLSTTDNDYATGLIPYVANSATIQNVTIVDSAFKGTSNVSAVVGIYSASEANATFTMKNVYVENTVINGTTGTAGIVGMMGNFTATGVAVEMTDIIFVDGSVTAEYRAGGIIGEILNEDGNAYANGVTLTMNRIVSDATLDFTSYEYDAAYGSSGGNCVKAGSLIGNVEGFLSVDIKNVFVGGSLAVTTDNTGSSPLVGYIKSVNTQGELNEDTVNSPFKLQYALAVPQMTNVAMYLSTESDAKAHSAHVTMKNIWSDTTVGTAAGRKGNNASPDSYPSGEEHKTTTDKLIGKQLFDGWVITGENDYPVPTARPVRLLGYQSSYKTDVKDANDANETYSVRLIAALNDTFYTEAGFENITITYEGSNGEIQKGTYTCKYAYKNVHGVDKNGVEQVYAAGDYYADSLIALEITGIPENVTEFTITLNAFAGKDDVTFDGITRTVQISAQ